MEEKVDHSKSVVETVKDEKFTKEGGSKKEAVVVARTESGDTKKEQAVVARTEPEEKKKEKEKEPQKAKSPAVTPAVSKVEDELEEEEIRVVNGNSILAVAEWSVDQVGEWLNTNQLSKYLAIFKEQAIDGSALLNLEEQYFGDLGITLIGDKIKLKNALNKLKETLKA